jgi:hypothetical protein
VVAAVSTISTHFGASTGLKVFIDESEEPTQSKVVAALQAVIAQIQASNLFTETYYD